MTSKTPYRISEINPDNICYTNIKSSNNKTIIYLNYMDSDKLKNLVFQTPSLLSINDIVCKSQSNNNLYELDIPLQGKIDTKVTKFINFLNVIDNKIIKDAAIKYQWFSSFSHQNTMKYQKIIRESTDGSNNSVIRIKILKTNNFETKVHLNNKRIPISEIPKNCYIKAILEIYAIWVNESGFGLFIRPILLDLKPINKIVYNYNLIEESDDNDDMDDIICTIQENMCIKQANKSNIEESVFIKSENEITSSVLEIPNNSSSDINNNNIIDSETSES